MQVNLRTRIRQPGPGGSRGRMRQARFAAVTAAVATSIALALPALAVTGTAPGLGVATSFAVLAGTTVTNTGPSVISGDLGVSPGSSVTGFGGAPNGKVVNGTIHAADGVAAQAEADLKIAYNNAAGQKPCTAETGKVLGQDIGTAATPLPPGVYCFTSSAQLTGALYLSGAGVYIFQVVSTLITAPGSSVVLENNASACQIFWQVAKSATLDTTTKFEGTIMALASITVNNGVVLEGRALARNGQVSLINDKITRPACTTPSAASTPSPTPALPAAGYRGAAPSGPPGVPAALVWLIAAILGLSAASLTWRHRT